MCKSKSGHLLLELLVLCHWATTAGQPPTITILYMFCTGGTEYLGPTPYSHSVCAVRISGWPENSFYQERTHAECFSCFKCSEHKCCEAKINECIRVKHSAGFFNTDPSMAHMSHSLADLKFHTKCSLQQWVSLLTFIGSTYWKVSAYSEFNHAWVDF